MILRQPQPLYIVKQTCDVKHDNLLPSRRKRLIRDDTYIRKFLDL